MYLNNDTLLLNNDNRKFPNPFKNTTNIALIIAKLELYFLTQHYILLSVVY